MGLNLCDRCVADCRHERNLDEIVIKCGVYKPPMTNADRIRAMSDERMIEQLAAERGRPFCNPNTCERLAIASELAAKMKVRALRAERLAETAREDCEGGRAVLATPEILEGMRKNGYVLDDEFYLPDGSVRQHWSYAEPGKPAGAASELERLELRAAGLARALEELSAELEELRAENKRLKEEAEK